MSLDFDALRRANDERQKQWDPDNALTLSYRGNELAGETGEACNVLKKLDRERLGLVGSRATTEELADELADVVICADLAAAACGIDLGDAVRAKFNRMSAEHGFTTFIPAPEAPENASATDREKALLLWAEWATIGWDRPDDDVASALSFTQDEGRKAMMVVKSFQLLYGDDCYIAPDAFATEFRRQA